MRLDDDPRTPRKNRQKSGVNLMHEEPWFGFNVADKMPHRNDADPAGITFEGFSRLIIAFQELTNAELDTDAVDGRTIKALEVDTGHLKDNAIKNAKLDGLAVSTGKLQDKAVDGGKLASNPHGVDPLGNANVNDDPLRAVGGAHIRTKAVDSYHLADNSVGKRALSVGLGGMSGKLPAHKISGKIPKSNISGVNWDQVDNKPPLATKHYVDQALEDQWKRSLRKFQQKP